MTVIDPADVKRMRQFLGMSHDDLAHAVRCTPGFLVEVEQEGDAYPNLYVEGDIGARLLALTAAAGRTWTRRTRRERMAHEQNRSRARRQRRFAWSAMMTWPRHENPLCRIFSHLAWWRALREDR